MIKDTNKHTLNCPIEHLEERRIEVKTPKFYQNHLLNPGVQPQAGNPEVTSIPQLDYSTSQRQLTSTQAEVAYLIKTPITTKPVVHTN